MTTPVTDHLAAAPGVGQGEDRQHSAPAGADKVTERFLAWRRSVLTPHKKLGNGFFFLILFMLSQMQSNFLRFYLQVSE